jgi:hypothetical protein
MLVATAGATGFLLLGKPTLFSSGPLSASHEQWEETCVTCHPPWGVKPMSVTCSAADCHAHELRANAQAQDDCRQCHTEHRGRSFNIRGDDTRCWNCHQEEFPERPVWHYYRQVFVASGERGRGLVQLALPAREEDRQAWEHSVPQEESGLIFAHTAHAKTSGQENCLVCHQPLPGEIVNALGAVSAFPTHTECIECHSEVGNADPQAAQALASRQCQKCHTRADGTVTRVQKTLDYVQFSHDSHKAADCVQCHFTVTSERAYRPVLRSALYPLPMEACVSCHEQQHTTTACLDCHRAHHSLPSEIYTDGGWLSRITLGNVLLTLLVLEGGVWAYMYLFRQVLS